MKQKKKYLLFACMIIMIFAFTGCGKKKVSLNKYITISTEGYDSVGTASCYFDYDAFIHDYDGKIKLSKNYKNAKTDYYNGITPAQSLVYNCVNYNLDKSFNLKNGDIINLTWNCNDFLASEDYNVEFEYSDITYTVTDLKTASNFNPFDYVTVEFSGTEPYGEAKITVDTNKKEMDYIKFTADKKSQLKKGDKITITASLTVDDETFTENFGEVIEKTEESYVCDSLAYYAKSAEDVSEDIMTAMKTQGEDIFRAYVAKDWEYPENLISVSYYGHYFLYTKSRDYFSDENCIYMVYKIQATNPDPEQTVDFYYFVRFNNIINLADGTCSVDLTDYKQPGYHDFWYEGDYFSVGNYKYIGYKNLESLFNNCVTQQIDNYTYTTDITE